MKRAFRASELLTAFLTQSLTPGQQKELDSWINSSTKNKAVFELLTDPDQLLKELRQFYEFESKKEEAFERICKKINFPGNPRFEATQYYEVPVIDRSLYDSILKHPHLMKSINWRQFEYFLKLILDQLEYEVELTQGSKDGGIDLIAIKKQEVFGTHRYLIQAKHQQQKVRVEPVQRLAFLINDHKATKGCLVTSSSFTRGAKELARKYNSIIELTDYDGLHQWIRLINSTKARG